MALSHGSMTLPSAHGAMPPDGPRTPEERRAPDGRGLAPDGGSPDLRQESFELPAQAVSVADARNRAYERLRCWGYGQQVCETARLVVSELFTNAVVHTDSDRVGCFLLAAEGRIRIEVLDQGSYASTPVLNVAGADDECGRGLRLIETMTEAWGVDFAAPGSGHVVWAVISPGCATT